MTTAAGALPRTPLGELTSFHQTLAVFKGSVSQLRRKGRMDRAGGKEMEEKNGETGEGMEWKGGSRLWSLLQEFMRAPIQFSLWLCEGKTTCYTSAFVPCTWSMQNRRVTVTRLDGQTNEDNRLSVANTRRRHGVARKS